MDKLLTQGKICLSISIEGEEEDEIFIGRIVSDQEKKRRKTVAKILEQNRRRTVLFSESEDLQQFRNVALNGTHIEPEPLQVDDDITLKSKSKLDSSNRAEEVPSKSELLTFEKEEKREEEPEKESSPVGKFQCPTTPEDSVTTVVENSLESEVTSESIASEVIVPELHQVTTEPIETATESIESIAPEVPIHSMAKVTESPERTIESIALETLPESFVPEIVAESFTSQVATESIDSVTPEVTLQPKIESATESIAREEPIVAEPIMSKPIMPESILPEETITPDPIMPEETIMPKPITTESTTEATESPETATESFAPETETESTEMAFTSQVATESIDSVTPEVTLQPKIESATESIAREEPIATEPIMPEPIMPEPIMPEPIMPEEPTIPDATESSELSPTPSKTGDRVALAEVTERWQQMISVRGETEEGTLATKKRLLAAVVARKEQLQLSRPAETNSAMISERVAARLTALRAPSASRSFFLAKRLPR